MKIGTIEASFSIDNFSTFKEWYDKYEKEIIIPYSEHIYPDTAESRSMINSIIAEMNKTIHEKWIYFGCNMPEITHVEINYNVVLDG